MDTIKGYVNVFKKDGMLQMGLGVFEEEFKATEVGKMTKGYITTIQVYFDVPIEEAKNE